MIIGDFYRSEWWQNERSRVLHEHGRSCDECNNTDGPFHVHHVYGIDVEEYRVLCAWCHAAHHGKPSLAKPPVAFCDICGHKIKFRQVSGGKWLPVDPGTSRRHECVSPHPFVPLSREPDLVYGPNETPMQCAKCGVELVNLRRPLCLSCYTDWIEGVKWGMD